MFSTDKEALEYLGDDIIELSNGIIARRNLEYIKPSKQEAIRYLQEEWDFVFIQGRVVFVFGSNLAGRHGKGAAKEAVNKWRAEYGVGEGFQGMSYAIPTKGFRLEVLPINVIEYFVNRFLTFAENHKYLTFYLTPIGCGLAGYSPEQIAPLFKNRLSNIIYPKEFLSVLEKSGGS